MLPVSTKEKTLSRSYKKQISFGRSTRGKANRVKKTYVDFENERRRREGLPLFKDHHRHNLQTLEDYITWVKRGFSVYGPESPYYCSAELKKYIAWLDGKEETDELIKQYAHILWKKDKSK